MFDECIDRLSFQRDFTSHFCSLKIMELKLSQRYLYFLLIVENADFAKYQTFKVAKSCLNAYINTLGKLFNNNNKKNIHKHHSWHIIIF
jgi:hypothetical protein